MSNIAWKSNFDSILCKINCNTFLDIVVCLARRYQGEGQENGLGIWSICLKIYLVGESLHNASCNMSSSGDETLPSTRIPDSDE